MIINKGLCINFTNKFLSSNILIRKIVRLNVCQILVQHTDFISITSEIFGITF